ncbi:hypothetical protein E3J79_01555 [Candidatus Dependentiae bacterium]|nr:MAG: hypothetical protein E3J79_01555 [Candidatus Dependentiae bacterium]
MKITMYDYKKGFMRNYIIPLLIVLFFSMLIVLAIFNLRVTSKYYLADLIVRDVTQLATIFERIDQECKILDFDYQKNRINFLNVKSFVGSEVGPMNLAYPDKWNGPYIDDNPTYQDKEYLVVRTKKGYFVTPGEGVKLPNGQIIGKDIILDEDADIPSMMKDENQLMFNGKQLAARLTIGVTEPGLIYQKLPIERI